MSDKPATLTTDWQPIETAPKDGRRILLWNGSRSVVAHFVEAVDGYGRKIEGISGHAYADTLSMVDGHFGYTNWLNDRDRPFTHWMPQPEPHERANAE